ncbi:U3 small nucleolar RNA-associated protein 25-like [Chenopodium quinoa]|uniref:U3 small nucleolar RNA-associated protein 25-like n=1 Tax=Chenopodium quinoa TaxID=63459 RepID=UPI000B77D17B|nr:U3 small nucleolar RNA-associated protein 25-like [Chenopodium quinoa]XP_021758158.1 U3 small nucleolar RNA-associated protein 25-like [Chenopodium quinoa]
MAKRFNRSQGRRPFTKLKSSGTISKKSRQAEPIDVRNKYPGSQDDRYKKHVKTTTFEDDVEEDVEEENEYNEEEEEDEDEDEDGDEEDEEEEIEPPSEPSVFDNLLKKLDTTSNSRAEVHQKRGRKSIKGGDSEDERDDEDDEEDDFNGSDDNIDRNSGKGDAITSSDDELTDLTVDDDFSDAENGLGEDIAEGLSSSSQSQSNFGIHITHKLSTEDIEKLLTRKWKYKWNMPALESSNCIWMGTGDSLQKDSVATAPFGVKLKLYKHWLEVYNKSGGIDFQSSKQRMFFSLCNSYRDILHHHKKPFYQKGLDEDSSTMDAYIMHSLNHVFKTKDIISKNDAKLSKNQETAREEVITSDSFLDQGFTRPKVLILLPLASIALRFVRRLIQLTPSAHKVNVEYMDRFNKDFGADEEDDDDIEAKDSKLKKPSKPSDYQSLFGANNNDHFMVGIKFTRKSIRLYSDFYSSDMIVASPLGLITKIGEAEANKEKDVDYLSSIEILVVDHADVISMQNWSHVNTVVEHLNLLPSKQHGGDIMRIRQWYLDAHAQFYRQTIILSSYLNPDINALFNRHCLNFEGKLRLSCEHKGVLPKVILQVSQVYERFDTDSIVEADDARLNYFINKIFPKIKNSIQGGIMLFISSYFEFVRIRNFLKTQNASFCLLGEYTKQSDISRARNWFIKGQRKIMLYTERAHFYHRYKIRGIQNLIIYSLPERKEFYPEVLNMLEEGSHNMTCTVLFSRFDQLRLERIVGSAAAKKMASSEKGLFIFK